MTRTGQGRFGAHPDRHDPAAPSPAASPAPGPDREPARPGAEPPCPGEEVFAPALRSLSTLALEDRVVYGGVLPPSAAWRQLEALGRSVQVYAEEQRRCLYRASLLQLLASAQGLLGSAEGWGRERPSAELRELFFSMPLAPPYSPAQREDLLRQVEEYVLPSLHQESEEDTEFWRRLYYALLLRTRLSDEALAELGATRPPHGLTFSPRV